MDHGAVFDNAIDFAHIHYLHSGSFGNSEQPEIRNIKVRSQIFSNQDYPLDSS